MTQPRQGDPRRVRLTLPSAASATKDSLIVTAKQMNPGFSIATGGFALLSALLAFFGITGGAVNDVVRNDPTAAIWVGISIGLGVIISIATPVLNPYGNRNAWFLLPLSMLVCAITMLAAPNLPGDGWWDSPAFTVIVSIGLVVAAIGAMLVSEANQLRLKSQDPPGRAAPSFITKWTHWMQPAAFIGLALSFIFLISGLYVAGKVIIVGLPYPTRPAISVDSGQDNAASTELDPRINVHATLDNPQQRMEVFVAGSLMADYGQEMKDRPSSHLLLRQYYTGTRSGVVDVTVGTKINPSDWYRVRFWACAVEHPTDSTGWQVVGLTATATDPALSDGDAPTDSNASRPVQEVLNDPIDNANIQLSQSDRCSWAEVPGTRRDPILQVDPLITGSLVTNDAGDLLTAAATVVTKSLETSRVCLQVTAVTGPNTVQLAQASISINSDRSGTYLATFPSAEWSGAGSVQLSQVDCSDPGKAEMRVADWTPQGPR